MAQKVLNHQKGGGGEQKVLTNKERGAKKVTKIDSIYLEISKFSRATQAL